MKETLALVILGLILAYLLAVTALKPAALVSPQGTASASKPASNYLIQPRLNRDQSRSQALEQIIRADIASSSATFGILVKNLTTGQEVAINPEEEFTTASLYKLAVMYTLFYKAAHGQIDISDADTQNNLKAMIAYSSNEAAQALVERYTNWKEMTDLMYQLGLRSTKLNQDPPVTTPSDMGKFLELLADGKAVDFDSSTRMLELLTMQQKKDRIPSLLPQSSTLIANKTGELDIVRHDVGIVGTPDNDYILVLMSKGSGKGDSEITPIMAKLSQDIYDFFEQQRPNP